MGHPPKWDTFSIWGGVGGCIKGLYKKVVIKGLPHNGKMTILIIVFKWVTMFEKGLLMKGVDLV